MQRGTAGQRSRQHPYLLFLDDDIVASPELVAEHLRSSERTAVPSSSARIRMLVSTDGGRLVRIIEPRCGLGYFRWLENRTPTFSELRQWQPVVAAIAVLASRRLRRRPSQTS